MMQVMLRGAAFASLFVVFFACGAFASQNSELGAKPAGCDWYFEGHGLCARLTNLALASSGAESSFDFVVTDLEGNLVAPNSVFVDLWMNMGSHGHGSRPVVLQEVAPAQYHVSKVYFVMGGMWDLRITLDPQTPQTEMATYQVMVPRSMGGM